MPSSPYSYNGAILVERMRCKPISHPGSLMVGFAQVTNFKRLLSENPCAMAFSRATLKPKAFAYSVSACYY